VEKTVEIFGVYLAPQCLIKLFAIMKRFLSAILSLIFVVSLTYGQDVKSLVREASRALNQYNLDQSGNLGKLKEGLEAINAALDLSEGQADPVAWNLKGQILTEVASQYVTIRQLGFGDPAMLPEVDDIGQQAIKAFAKALELSQKRPDIRNANKGLQNLQSIVSNYGIYQFEEQNFDEALSSFTAAIEAHELLKKQEEKSTLDNEEELHNQYFIAGVAALQTNNLDHAKTYFQKLYDKKYDRPTVYEAMYKIKSESDLEGAYAYLEEGRQRYPDDVSLLFTDINHALRTNQLDKLLTKLEDAIEKEPENVSLYTTMGSVYDQLYQQAAAKDNDEEETLYFNKALEYYEKALELDPSNFDATYSVGTLYYNKAAVMSLELNKLADDYSREGTRRYEALRAKVFEQFDLALPYFQRCEKINPNDANTLIALKEIYARKDQLDVSEEFRKRLETVQEGGKNAKSYFN
jgi:tetratricopeptide (TPR) repeat protein